MSEKRASKPSSLTRPVLTKIDGIEYDLAREGQPAWPGGPPTTPPHPDWTELENICWIGIHAGCRIEIVKEEIAEKKEAIANGIKIRNEFIETILFSEPWCTAIPSQSVEVEGALIEGILDLELKKIPGKLAFCNCILDEMRAEHAIFMGDLDVASSTFRGSVALANARIEGTLRIENSEVGNCINLEGAVVKKHVSCGNRTKCCGEVKMNHIKVGGSVFMNDKSEYYGNVDLTRATIGGQLVLKGESKFKDNLTLERMEVGDSLFLSEKSVFDSVNLSGTRVGGQLSASGGEYLADIIAQGVVIKEDLDLYVCDS